MTKNLDKNPAHNQLRTRTFFAWLPVTLEVYDGTQRMWIWLEKVEVQERFNATEEAAKWLIDSYRII